MSLSETQEQILDAVTSVIVRDGVEGASMRTVAQEADVSVGLLSYHFDDKQSLIVAAFDRVTDQLLEASVDAMSEVDDPDERVRAYIRGAFAEEFLAPDYLTLRIALWAVSRTDEAIAAVERSLSRRYADRLGSVIGEARPSLPAKETVQRSTDIIVLSNGLWLHWARYESPVDLERGLRRCEAIALD